MRCHVCGHGHLIETEYRTAEVTAPALECERCHAINLDERVAKSERERDAVRRAVAARGSAGADFDSGTHRTRHAALPIGQVDSALSAIDLLLAQARVVLELLSETTDSDSGKKGIADLARTIERIDAVVDDLGKRCVREIAKEVGVGIARPVKRGLAS